MKWYSKIMMIFMALVVPAGGLLAQSGMQRPAVNPGSPPPPPAQVEVNPSSATPTSPATGVQGQPQTPTTPAIETAATPAAAATYQEPTSWSTAVLRDAITKADYTTPVSKTKRGKKASSKLVTELRSKIALKPKDLKSRLRLASHFEAVNKPSEIIEVLRPASDSLNREGLLTLARAYHAKEDYLQEARVLQQQLMATPSDYVVHTLLGEAHAAMKNLDKAIESFSEARRLNSKYLPPYEATLRENLKNGQWADSMSTAQEVSDVFGETPKLLNQLCLLYADQAFLDKAVESCKAAIAKDPKRAENHVFLALSIRERDGDSAASKIIQSAAKQFPKSELAQYVAGEFSYSSLKNQLAAVKYFKQAVKNDKKSARSHLGLAKASFDEKNYEDALAGFVSACQLNRAFISDFRKSTGLLRRSGKQVMWAARFERGMGECGYR